MKKETINWKGVEALGYKRAIRLRKIEKALSSHPEGLSSGQLCHEIGLTTKSKTRTLQKDIEELKELYTGGQTITRSPHKLLLKGRDLAFSEAEFNTNDRKQLNAIYRVIAFFDGAVPIKRVLNVSIRDVENALKDMSDSIDISTNSKEIMYIKEIFEAIENRKILDIIFPHLNHGKKFAFAPYLLKRFNNKWFVIGRMYIDHPFDWTVIPLAAILFLNQNNGVYQYIPNEESKISELKQRIHAYYDKVMGFYVPTNEPNPEKVPRTLDPQKLNVEEICIKCSPKALRLIKENPIHSPQRISEETSEVMLQLVVNPLLIQRILGFGDEVEVMSPSSLRETIKATIEKMVSKYQTK